MSRILFIIIVSLLSVGCTMEMEQTKPPLDVSKLNMGLESQIAFQKSEEIYQQAVEQGLDLSNGPCLSNALHGNADYPETMWVFDIVHEPRQEIDNQPENQCSAFREGKAKNYIEFSLEGELIEVYSPLLSNK